MEDGVLILDGTPIASQLHGAASTADESVNADVYSKYWGLASQGYDEGGYSDEDSVISGFDRFIKDQVVLDAGCGDGRHLPLWSALQARGVVCVDISNGIFLARQRHLAQASLMPTLFIKGSLAKLPLSQAGVDTAWCSGTINLLDDQERALSELARVTRRQMVLGLTSNNTLGTIYQRLNLVRPLCRFLFEYRLLWPFTLPLAILISAYCKLFTRLNRKPLILSAASARRIAEDKEGIKKLYMRISEPFVSPNIKRLPDDRYEALLGRYGFGLRLEKSDFLIDYFVCEPSTASRK